VSRRTRQLLPRSKAWARQRFSETPAGIATKHLIYPHFAKRASMSGCLVIFHKQLGDLILLEPALRRLAHANGHSVDLITRSGFQPMGSLMPHVSFRSKPNTKIYDALWCFDDRRKSAFYSLLSRAREKHLLIIPGASIQFFGHTNARCLHRETAYSRALVTGDLIGIQSSRLLLLPHEPVIEAVLKLWRSN
jgi:hypothetical protein